MATRFYLPAFTGGPVPSVSPGYGSIWDETTSGGQRLVTSTTKANVAFENRQIGETSASATYDVLFHQYVSDNMDAQLIDGSFSGVVRAMQSAAAADDSLQVMVRVASEDGTVERAVLYGGHAAALNTTAGALGQEFAVTTPATRVIPAGTALTSYTCVSGDRLVIEIGYRSHDTATTARNSILRFGDPTATADFALTAGLTTDLCPWMELSATLTFLPPPAGRVPNKRLVGKRR